MSWTITATPAVASLVLEIWGEYGLEGTEKYRKYLADALWRYTKAHLARSSKRWPEIPITALQPIGKWMHQRRAFWFAYYIENAMLAVTMGGGKTKIAIDLMQNWNAKDVLIISPLAACEDAWIPQLERYVVPDRGYNVALSFTGSSDRRLAAAETVLDQSDADHRIILINHEAFWREPYRSFILDRDWDLVIDDEIHREKSAGSKQSLALYQLGSRARRRLGLTGTPMPNSPLDVYGQYRFLDRGIYGTRKDSFDQKYAEFGGYQFREVVGFRNTEDLMNRFYSIGIIIDDGEQGLPETVDIDHKVELTGETRRVYKEMEKDFITKAKGSKGEAVAANVGVKLLRLHEIASGILTTGEKPNVKKRRNSTEKLEMLERVIREDIPVKEPIVIFTRFAMDTEAIVGYLGGYELSGRANDLAMWKKHGGVLVAQIQAAKEGIDLTLAAYAIFYSTGINLGDYLQCRKRLHRPPQTRMVRFIHLLAAGTKDVSTMRALREKRDVIDEVLREIQTP